MPSTLLAATIIAKLCNFRANAKSSGGRRFIRLPPFSFCQPFKNDPATAPAVQFYCKVPAEPAAASANGMAIAPPATPKLLRGMAFMSTSPFTERRSAST